MKRRSSAASRDSKRDVTANPIRKTSKSAAAGQESRRQAVEVAAVDLRGLNIGVQSLWCCQWNWVVKTVLEPTGWKRGFPVSQFQNAPPQCHTFSGTLVKLPAAEGTATHM